MMCGREPDQASDERYLARQIDEVISGVGEKTFGALIRAVNQSDIYLDPRGKEVAVNRVENALRKYRNAEAEAAQTSLLDFAKKGRSLEKQDG